MTSSQLLANRYQMIRQLAAGSFAETWLATDIMLDRFVAIKVLHPDSGRDPVEETEEFLREARIAASVSHPNVVAVFDAGSQNDRPFLVMEWVDGASLKHEIVSTRRMSAERAITVASELLDGLDSIHEQSIIHRDVKPQNIMVNEFGTIKLTDFGIARLSGENDGLEDGTTTGSAAYMSPEQAQGLPVSPASDTYAAGVILYEMLTGRLPFRHDDPQQVLLQHISEPVPRPRRINPSIPAQVEAIVLQALEKDPENRFATAQEMRQALIAARAYLPVRRRVAFEPMETESTESSIPRFAWMAATVAFMFVLLAGATTLAVRDFSMPETLAGAADAGVIVEPTEVPESPSEPEASVEPTPTEVSHPQWERREGLGYIDDDDVIRGEIVIEGSRESAAGVNRPAPSREATDDDLDDEDEEEQQAVASTNTQQQQQQVQPTPTPQPEPTATPDASGDDEDEASEPEDTESGAENPDESDDSDENGDDPGNSGNSEDQGNGNSNGNGSGSGQGNSSENGNDDDAPASNQGRNDDDDDDDSSASPQSSSDVDDDATDDVDDDRNTAQHQRASSDDDDDDSDDRNTTRHQGASSDDDDDSDDRNTTRHLGASSDDDDDDSDDRNTTRHLGVSSDDDDDEDLEESDKESSEKDDKKKNDRDKKDSKNSDDSDSSDDEDEDADEDDEDEKDEKKETKKDKKQDRKPSNRNTA